jgi:hypothetical protein
VVVRALFQGASFHESDPGSGDEKELLPGKGEGTLSARIDFFCPKDRAKKPACPFDIFDYEGDVADPFDRHAAAADGRDCRKGSVVDEGKRERITFFMFYFIASKSKDLKKKEQDPAPTKRGHLNHKSGAPGILLSSTRPG